MDPESIDDRLGDKELTLSLLMTTQEAFVDSVDQHQTECAV